MDNHARLTKFLRALIRWLTGATVAAGIAIGCYGLSGKLSILGLAAVPAIIVGLRIARPPIHPEDDWVCIGSHRRRGREN